MPHPTPTRRTPDEIGLLALASGDLTVDTDTGAVHHRDGRRAEYPCQNGYGLIPISDGTRATTIGAHRLVWLALHGPIPGGLRVNHINKRTWDNRPDNLELVTPAGNWHHGHGSDYVHIGPNGVDPAWLHKVNALLESGDITPEALAPLRGEAMTSDIAVFSGGSVVSPHAPARAKRRNA